MNTENNEDIIVDGLIEPPPIGVSNNTLELYNSYVRNRTIANTINFITSFIMDEFDDLDRIQINYYGADDNDTEYQEILNYSFHNDVINQPQSVKDIKLYSKRYKKIKHKHPDEKNCSICLSDYDDEDRIVINLKCKHIFHKTCIKEWGKVSTNCPICRNEMDEK